MGLPIPFAGIVDSTAVGRHKGEEVHESDVNKKYSSLLLSRERLENFMNRIDAQNAETSGLRKTTANRWSAYGVAIVAFLQLLFTLLYVRTYWDLVKTGVISGPAGLLASVALVLLYLAAIRFAINSLRGKRFFLFASIGLAWSTYAWGFPKIGAFPFLVGAVVGIVGWWFVRTNLKQFASREGSGG